jgi:hypothetical protein
MTKQLHARTPMTSTAPVMPEEWFIPDSERMQENTHLARLFGGVAIPLALLPQRAGTTTAKAGAIRHAQAPIGFSAVLMREQRLFSGTPQRSIRLERKVLA